MTLIKKIIKIVVIVVILFNLSDFQIILKVAAIESTRHERLVYAPVADLH